MKKFVRAGRLPAFAAAMLLTFGGSGQALAQQVGNLPLVQAVVKTASAVTSPETAASTLALGSDAALAQQAAVLQRAGWPLYALVDRFAAGAPLTDEANCIAVAVYHEARGESLEGQMAVAKVIMNRAASGKYPTSWCGVVKQPWQFSFVRRGQFPSVDQSSTAWHKALGVTRLAVANAVQSVPSECLWYHADYVAPSWGRNLTRVEKIGAHIFYRA
ncbi:cell wall hydrolase [Sphingomonas sp. RB56-2]|uniref:Cell wall hydrolase n=1 Tax=Sphingomonas brevis TaxID=2908206 RepID=A0ABT0S5N9_9SPHN|nr:cell wall hydrolase [Sphingomonas brevis]MCL6739710.1 cell wall hydrolase [Sphingomonas brevis]